MYEDLIAIASFIAGDISTVESIDDLSAIVQLVFDAFSALADDIDWSNSDVSILDATNLCLVFGDSRPVKVGSRDLIMKMKDFVQSISDGAVANPNQVTLAGLLGIQDCTNLLMNATTALSLQQSRRKLAMTAEDAFSVSTVCHDSMHGTSRVAATKLTDFAPLNLNYDYFKIQVRAYQPSMWQNKILPPFAAWGIEPDANMYADYSAIGESAIVYGMTGFMSIVIVMLDSPLPATCVYDGRCEHVGLLGSTLYEVLIRNPTDTYKEEAILYSYATSSANATSGVAPEPKINVQNCFQGDFMSFSCPLDYTNGVADISLNKTCPAMGEVLFQCPVFTQARICGDSVVNEDGYCIADASRSTDKVVACACRPRYTTYGGSARRRLEQSRKLFSLDAYQSFEVSTSLIIADQEVYPSNISFIKLVVAEKGTIASTSFDTKTFSYVFPSCVVGCCLIIGLIYFYRRYKRKQLEEKYTKDMTYTIHDFPDLLRRGRELRADNELEEAERILREAVNLVEGPDGGEISPEDASAAYYELASVLSLLGRHEEALPLYQQAHGVFKGGKTEKGDVLKTDSVVLQIPEDNASDASHDSNDASDSSTHSEALFERSDEEQKPDEIVINRIDTSSTIESTGFNANYDDFYDVLKMAGVSANIPLRQRKATRAYVGPDGVAVGAGTKLEGGYEDEATGTTSTML
jgi:tetratricopeptide (TPR) repeat protein